MSDADVITRMLHAIDARDWATARNSFADDVRMDYTSLWGGEAETLPADTLIARWQEFVSQLAATQHITGQVLTVDGHLHTHVIAYHWLLPAGQGGVFTVHGHYVARVAGERIADLTLQTIHTDGNPPNSP